MNPVLLILMTNVWLCSSFQETTANTLYPSSTTSSSWYTESTSTPTPTTSSSSSLSSSSSWEWNWGEETASSTSVTSTVFDDVTASSSSSYSESSSTYTSSVELNPTPTSTTSASSSSAEVLTVEMLFMYLYQALENDREIDHLKRRKRREAEKPGLPEKSDLAFRGKEKRRLENKNDFVMKILRRVRKRDVLEA